MVMVVFVVMTVVMLMFVLMFVVMPVMGLVMGRLVDVLVDGIPTVPQGHIVAVLLLAVDGDGHVGAPDTAGGGGLGLHGNAGEQAVHGVQKPGLVLQQLVQGAHQHVAGGAHVAFQI